jgi:hypothetical protein
LEHPLVDSQIEEFFGPNPAPSRVRTALRSHLLIAAAGGAFFGGGLFFLQDFTTGKDLRYYAYLIALLLIGTTALVAGFSGAFKRSRQLAMFRDIPPADVLWHVLDEKGLHICNTITHTPRGSALVPWTEMISVELIDAAEPIARLTYRGFSDGPSRMDLSASNARADGARLGDRLRSRFALKGKLEPEAAPVNAAVSEDFPISEEEIARIKKLMAESRRPREPVTGPDGLPIPAPPPPVFEDKPPVRDDRPEPPTDRERTIPGP